MSQEWKYTETGYLLMHTLIHDSGFVMAEIEMPWPLSDVGIIPADPVIKVMLTTPDQFHSCPLTAHSTHNNVASVVPLLEQHGRPIDGATHLRMLRHMDAFYGYVKKGDQP
jgi:hypothetical protein